MGEDGISDKLEIPEIEDGAWVAPGVIAAGVPAKVRRELTDADRARLERAWKTYAGLRDLHKPQ